MFKKEKKLDIQILNMSYKTVRQALVDILKTEVKVKDNSGVEKIDINAVSSMKLTARTALDFVDGLRGDNVDKKEKSAY